MNSIGNVLYEYGVDKTPTYVGNLECTGNESHINECTYDINNTCSYWDQVAIKCTGMFQIKLYLRFVIYENSKSLTIDC